MLIAWTTVETKEDAESLASLTVANGLAACVQVEGPVSSFYKWEGKERKTEEYRLCFKLLESQSSTLESFVRHHHPYTTPEWIVVRAEHVSEKYLSWAMSLPTSSTL